MANMPKRRKMKDNPYTLDIKDNDIYVVNFKDNKNIIHSIEVSEKVFNAFNKFELEDIKLMHEYERHIEHLELDDNSIHNKSLIEDTSVEDIVEEKILNDVLKDTINELSDTQKRRLKMYYFENKTLSEIANVEHCSIVSVKESIDSSIRKLAKIIKK